jgi:cephalosporin-C deacetylase-like acetyl esterase
MNPYLYHNNTSVASVSVNRDNAGWSSYSVRFPQGIEAKYIDKNFVKGEYYRPKGVDKSPLVILVHGMGDYSTVPCQLLAKALVREKIACFVIYLVTHSIRAPESIKGRIRTLTNDEWFEVYQLSITDIQQVVDWAQTRNEINPDEIAVFGISFGGLTSSIAMGLDNRIKAGVLMVAGGNTEKIMRFGGKRLYHYSRPEEEYRQMIADYSTYLDDVSEKGFENIIPSRQSYLTDPMTYASYLKGRPVLMMNAVQDIFIPREAALDFWQACGKPAIKWFPTGHTTIWLFYPSIRKRILSFLKDNLFNNGVR